MFLSNIKNCLYLIKLLKFSQISSSKRLRDLRVISMSRYIIEYQCFVICSSHQGEKQFDIQLTQWLSWFWVFFRCIKIRR